jgi:hypothetical protein
MTIVSGPNGEQDPLQALIAKYDLRDGNLPDEPFIAADNRSDLPPGWVPLAEQLIQDLIRLGWDRRVLQIKEKFGTLRLYISQRELPLVDLTIDAREKSGIICQECGGAGTLLEERHYYATLCDSCRARLRAERGEG